VVEYCLTLNSTSILPKGERERERVRERERERERERDRDRETEKHWTETKLS
jgi:hypothetical protein